MLEKTSGDSEGEQSTSSDVIVLGCGVSGLTVAHLLSGEGHRVTVLDDYSEPGGNHISRNIDGYTFDIGAIFFWSNSLMLPMFPTAVATWVPIVCTTGRVTPACEVRDYPFDMKREFFDLPLHRKALILSDIAFHRLFFWRRRTASDFAVRHLGSHLFRESGLARYFERFYGLSPDKVIYAFALRRMQWIRRHSSVTHIARKHLKRMRDRLGKVENGAPLQAFARPAEGFPHMYREAVSQLEAQGVRFVFDAGTSSIRRDGNGFRVEGKNGDWSAKRLISTFPMALTAQKAGILDVEPPNSNVMTTLFCRFRGNIGFPYTILYNFHARGAWKRLTMHSNYYGEVDGYAYFSVECVQLGDTKTTETLFSDFVDTASAFDIFDGKIELVGHLDTDFAYPVLDAESDANRTRLLSRMSEMGIEGIGRQGNFDYIPNSSMAIGLVRKALERPDAAGLST